MASASAPSPAIPLLILGLVITILIVPWYLTLEAPEAEEEDPAGAGPDLSLAPLVLVPVLLVFVLRYMSSSAPKSGSYSGLSSSSAVSGSSFLIGGILALVLMLLWFQPSMEA